MSESASDEKAAQLIREAAELIKPGDGEAVFYIRVGGTHSQFTVKSNGINPERAMTLLQEAVAAEARGLARCPAHNRETNHE